MFVNILMEINRINDIDKRKNGSNMKIKSAIDKYGRY